MTDIMQNFGIPRGDSIEVTIPVKNSDGTPYDFNGVTDVHWMLAKSDRSIGSDVLIHRKLSLGGLTIESGGLVKFTLTRTDTNLDPAWYYHELKVQRASNYYTATQGNLAIGLSLDPT